MLLHSDFFPRHPCAKTFFNLWLRSQVLADCDSDVVQRLFARRPLAVAAWKVIAPNGETLFRFYDRHVVRHHPKNAAVGEVAQDIFEVQPRSEAGSFSLINSKRPASAGRFCFLGSAPGSGAGFGRSPKRTLI